MWVLLKKMPSREHSRDLIPLNCDKNELLHYGEVGVFYFRSNKIHNYSKLTILARIASPYFYRLHSISQIYIFSFPGFSFHSFAPLHLLYFYCTNFGGSGFFPIPYRSGGYFVNFIDKSPPPPLRPSLIDGGREKHITENRLLTRGLFPKITNARC
jgi:hypothetical protein